MSRWDLRTTIVWRRLCRYCNGTARTNCLAITTLLHAYKER